MSSPAQASQQKKAVNEGESNRALEFRKQKPILNNSASGAAHRLERTVLDPAPVMH